MIGINEIQAAHERIKKYIHRTPVLTSSSLDEMSSNNLYFKCENFQRVGAFKFRGACNAILQNLHKARKYGVITHSSGNHAQALAKAAQILDIEATIVMPKNAPEVKRQATRDTYRANVVLCENTIESRHNTTQQLMRKYGQILIHPYDDVNIIAGAGTAALELLEDYPDLDIIITPVGGGGLLSGTAICAKNISSTIAVYAAEPEIVNDAFLSLQAGRIITNSKIETIADGLRTNLSDLTFEIISEYVNKIITVSEDEILRSMKLVWERMKIIIEPSSAVALAAIMSDKFPYKKKKIGLIVSGGNVCFDVFFTLLRRSS